MRRYMEPLRYPQDYEGYRYICTTHEWMDSKNPCPGGDGTDRGYQEPLPGHYRIENGKVIGDHPDAERSGDAYMETIIISAAQLRAVAEWAVAGPDMAQVTLTVHGDTLRAVQGDDIEEFSPDGSTLPEDA